LLASDQLGGPKIGVASEVATPDKRAAASITLQ